MALVITACGESRNWTVQQKQGKRIYESLCDKCHTLVEPKKLSDTQWAETVPRYGTKLKLRKSEIESVVAYLQAANDDIK